MKYELVVADFQKAFERAVQDKLDHGWRLLGAPFVTREGAWVQAMVIE